MNNGLFNKTKFNQTDIKLINVEDVTFNGFGLYNSNIIALGLSRDYNTIEYNIFPLPQQNSNGFINSFNRGVTFSMNFAIKGETQIEVDTLYDNMLNILSYKEGTLKYKPFGGNYREIKCTMTSITTTERTSKYIIGNIGFSSASAFWSDSQLNSRLTSNISLSPFNIQILNNGVESISKMYFIFGTGNVGVNNITISCNNRTLNLNFSSNISNGDILLIDNNTKKVYLNNVIQEYTGTFNKLINGVNAYDFTINGTFNVDISIIYPTNYLLP